MAKNGTLDSLVTDAERKLIEDSLKKHNANRTHTAAALGISRRALIYKITEHGLETAGMNAKDASAHRGLLERRAKAAKARKRSKNK